MEISHTFWLLMALITWYISSIMVNVNWKLTFKSYGQSTSTSTKYYHYAMFFTTVQLAAGAVTSFLIIVCSRKLEKLTSGWRYGAVIGFFFYFGQLSTNISLTISSVTLTHMVKTLEPLLALLWSLTIFKNNISFVSIMHMLMILVGVLLAGYNEETFNLIGVIFAIVSNVSLSLRNLFIKLLNDDKMVNVLKLFFVSCLFGFLYSLLLYLFIMKSFMNNDYNYFSIASIQMGMYFSLQHTMSYLLLSYISITSHALMNCLKRALIIFVSAILLKVTLPPIQSIGIIVAIIGSIFYVSEIKKTFNVKSADKDSSEWCKTITPIVGSKFLIPYKLILFLPLTLILCLTITYSNQYNIHSSRIVRHKYVTAVWAFDASINLKSLEIVTSTLDTDYFNFKIFCFNLEKCQKSFKELNSTTLSIQTIQLKAFEISKDTPVASWIAAHPINKIKSLSCFPAYFHKMMYLSVLWKYGGVVIDMGLNLTDNSDVKNFMISPSSEGCLLDQNKSTVVICKLFPKHEYTEVFMGEVFKLFKKNPKSCTFDNSLKDLNNLTNLATSSIGYTIPSAETKFGLLGYGPTNNMGDEVQSIAAAHILPHIYTFMDRDNFKNKVGTNLTYIGNAWWGGRGIIHKDIPKLITVPVAVYILPGLYKKIKERKLFFTAMAPIGARDLTTFEMLTELGIDSIFTGCLTLWMKNPNTFTNQKRKNQTIIVDVFWKHNPIPKTLTNIKYMSHYWGPKGNIAMGTKIILAYENLMQYSQAKLVVTSRLHVALPCVAFGTPVIFLNSREIFDAGKFPTPRVAGLLDMFHTVDMYKLNETEQLMYFKTFNWDSPPPNPNPEKVNFLKKEAKRIIERIPELAVSIKVFELI